MNSANADAKLASETDDRNSRCRMVSQGLAKVAQIDLFDIKRKIDIEEELPCSICSITSEYVERRYREFLSLQFAYPDRRIVPSKHIDMFWHYHILDTRAYQADCYSVFGEFLHHYPYFGLGGEADAQDLEQAFADTCQLWQSHFGYAPDSALAVGSPGNYVLNFTDLPCYKIRDRPALFPKLLLR